MINAVNSHNLDIDSNDKVAILLPQIRILSPVKYFAYKIFT